MLKRFLVWLIVGTAPHQWTAWTVIGDEFELARTRGLFELPVQQRRRCVRCGFTEHASASYSEAVSCTTGRAKGRA